jgi:DNA-binding NtrC family response regulator
LGFINNVGKDIILCVDDDESVLMLRQALLSAEGREVVTAISAAAALDVLAKRPVDLVITDQLMKGMNGPELAVQIKKQSPQVKALILSGLYELEGATDNADAFMCKTEPPTVLLALVKELLNSDVAA